MKPRILTIKANDHLSPQIKLCVHEGEVRKKGGYNYPLPVGRALGQAEPGEDVRVEVYPDVLKRIEWTTPGTVPKWLLDAIDAPCSCGHGYIERHVEADGVYFVCLACGGKA